MKMLKYLKICNRGRIMFKLDYDKLIDSINKKWTSKACPMCGQNNWTVDNEIQTIIKVGEKKDVKIGGKFFPLVTVTCLNCGNVVFINPLVIDAVEDTENGE